jgi:hypothetical protein
LISKLSSQNYTQSKSPVKYLLTEAKPNIYWNQYNLSLIQLESKEPTFYKNTFFLNSSSADNLIFNPKHVVHKYLFFRKSTITSFFSINLVDMPICFKKSKSLYNTTFEIPLFKFLNLLMRRGQRTQALKFVTKGFNSIFLQLYSKYSTTLMNWSFLYKTLNNLNFQTINSNLGFKNQAELYLDQKTELNGDKYLINPQVTTFNKFLFLLEKYFPIFSFSIKRVNKGLRKNSRGKSGKYTVMWKYVPVYKRLYITMRWFLKDLKFQKNSSIEARFSQILEHLFLTPERSFLHNVRYFTHRYVFKHFKKTLVRSLKSV